MGNKMRDFNMPCYEIWKNLINCGGYNSDVDDMIIERMEKIQEDEDSFADNKFDELINYILCSMNYAEYGTSPSGCWLTEKGEEMLKVFKERQKTLYWHGCDSVCHPKDKVDSK